MMMMMRHETARQTGRFLFGLKLCFSRILDSLYSAFWRCTRVRL